MIDTAGCPAQRDSEGTRQFGFLLFPNFPLMSYASAVEPLRAANLLSGKPLYRWQHISVDGDTVLASTGVGILPDGKIGDDLGLDTLFVCAGGNPAKFRHRQTLQWLRSLARSGVSMAGMSGGPFVLARAGLLDGRRCTLHWEHIPAFVEDFPELDVRRTLYEIDRDRITCAGGISSLDMMIELIERDHGVELSGAVSEWYLRTQPRTGSGPQRMPLRERHGVSNERLIRVLTLMEARIEDPLTLAEMAESAGITSRQLERLFTDNLHDKPSRYYLKIRLSRAQNLLRQTSLSIAEVAMATGFVSTSHFSRVYSKTFSRSPKQDRVRS